MHQNDAQGKISCLNALLWSRHLDNLSFQFVSIPVKEFEYQFFTCAAGVNNSNVGLHKHFLACRSVSICCGFHGDFVSSACVQADRTWPVSSAGVRGQVLLFLQTLNLPLFHQCSHQLWVKSVFIHSAYLYTLSPSHARALGSFEEVGKWNLYILVFSVKDTFGSFSVCVMECLITWHVSPQPNSGFVFLPSAPVILHTLTELKSCYFITVCRHWW